MQRIILPLIVTAILGWAGPIPVLVEGQAVDPAHPGLGAHIYANPDSRWFVAFEDRVGAIAQGSDRDFNDWVGWVSFTADSMLIQVIEAISSHQITVNYQTYTIGKEPGSQLLVPLLANGQVIVLGMSVPTLIPGLIWYSGPSNANWDGMAHALVVLVPKPPPDDPEIPEPSSLALGALGLLALGALHRRCRRS